MKIVLCLVLLPLIMAANCAGSEIYTGSPIVAAFDGHNVTVTAPGGMTMWSGISSRDPVTDEIYSVQEVSLSIDTGNVLSGWRPLSRWSYCYGQTLLVDMISEERDGFTRLEFHFPNGVQIYRPGGEFVMQNCQDKVFVLKVG